MVKFAIQSEVIMILVLNILFLGNLSETIDMKGFLNSDLADSQLQSIEALRGSDNTQAISEELRERIDDTLVGFTGGFLENNGQKNDDIFFYTESSQMAVGFSTSEIRFSMVLPRTETQIYNDPPVLDLSKEKGTYTSITLKFLGSNKVVPVGEAATGVYRHFFIGLDETKWSTNNQFYSKVIYQNLYDHIDLIYELKNGQLKYEFYIYPGGNFNDIKLHWTGPVSLEQIDSGIKIKTRLDEILKDDFSSEVGFIDTTPICYQSYTRKKSSQGSFNIIDSQTYGFDVPVFDPKKLLIIDPLVLTYSTYVGGSVDDLTYGIAVDGEGNAYVTGYTESSDFPVANAYNATHISSEDVFVFKLAADGKSLLYSTYIGGSDEDKGRAIAVDGAGHVYVTGTTYSSDFPVVNAYNATLNFFHDVFVFKLTADGSNLLYSTYVGGSGFDYGYGIAVDGVGYAHVAGYTDSSDFPVVNAYNSTYGGAYDVFVFKLAPDGSSLLYSTYIGRNSNDRAYAIAMDEMGNVYVTGNTESDNFPMVNAYDSTYNGGFCDIFVFKLAVDGNNLLYSTYFGGNRSDYAEAIALDGAGCAYVTGMTTSTDLPVLDPYNATGDSDTNFFDAFVFKLNSTGNGLHYSTYVSGSDHDYGKGITVDEMGYVYVAGHSQSTDFPVVTPYDAIGDSSSDIIVFKLSMNGSNLLYSTYVGRSGSDTAHAIAVDGLGNAYIAGNTDSNNFPVVNAYDLMSNGGTDVGVFKLSLSTRPSSPQGLSATISYDRKVILLWEEPVSIGNLPLISYHVYRSTISGSYDSFLFETTDKFCLDATVVEGITYFYVITAVNSLGESDYSNEVKIIVPSLYSCPSTPQNLSTTSSDDSINLYWIAPIDDGGSTITRYNIYRGTTSGDYMLLGLTIDTNYTDATALAGVMYFYVVTAVNSIGESPFSNQVIATLSGTPAIPLTVSSPPQNLSVTRGENFVTLTWTTPSDDGGSFVIKYNVYRGTLSGKYALLGVTIHTSYRDDLVIENTTYFFVVTAVNGVGESTFSIEVIISLTAPEAATTETSSFLEAVFVLSIFSVVLIVTRRRKE